MGASVNHCARVPAT
uniref:Uncharacterized protein n=1 Tax=Arundo donax TaxID=35708 RepID=A0A0A9AXZ1_ARUDO